MELDLARGSWPGGRRGPGSSDRWTPGRRDFAPVPEPRDSSDRGPQLPPGLGRTGLRSANWVWAPGLRSGTLPLPRAAEARAVALGPGSLGARSQSLPHRVWHVCRCSAEPDTQPGPWRGQGSFQGHLVNSAGGGPEPGVPGPPTQLFPWHHSCPFGDRDPSRGTGSLSLGGTHKGPEARPTWKAQIRFYPHKLRKGFYHQGPAEQFCPRRQSKKLHLSQLMLTEHLLCVPGTAPNTSHSLTRNFHNSTMR